MSQSDYIKYKTVILKLVFNKFQTSVNYADFQTVNVYYLASSIENTKDTYNSLIPPGKILFLNIEKVYIPINLTLLPPTGLTPVESTDSSITISFTPPTGEAVDTFTITADPVTPDNPNDSPIVQTFPGYFKTYTITGLQSDSVYLISIVSKKNTITSILSDIIVYSTVLLPPTNLNVGQITDTTIDISFTPPSAGTVNSYTVRAVSNSGAIVEKILSVYQPVYTITGLQNDTTYTISVFATNFNGNSAPSISATARTYLSPPSLQVTGRTSSTISCLVTGVTGTVISYTITATPTSGSVVSKTFTETTTTLTNLQSDMLYTITVYSINAFGRSSDSSPVQSYTLLLPPTNLQHVSRTVSSITISFTPPSSGNVVDYMVTATPSTGNVVTQYFTGTTYEITDLQSGMSYTIRVFSRNANGTSDASLHLHDYTVLEPPTTLVPVGNTDASITFSFTAATGFVTGYEVIARYSSGQIGPLPTTNTTYTLTNLQSDTSYNISVIAKNADVSSVESSILQYYTLLLPPRDLFITNPTDTSFFASFSAPLSGNVVDYKITTLPISSDHIITGTTHTITGLQSNTDYTIYVYARNSRGTSAPLISANSYKTLLPPPTNITTTEKTETSIHISYSAPSGGSSYTYTITVSPAPSVTIPANISATNYNITGLQANTSYTINVVANDANGNYSPPLSATIKTLLSPPTNITTIGKTDTSINISYNAPSGGSSYTYTISVSPAPSVAIPSNIYDTSYNITGLQANTSYTINVVANDSNSNYSLPLIATVKTLLSPLSNLKGESSTDTSILISYSAPLVGSPYTYTISVSPAPSVAIPANINDTSYNITGLQANTLYTITAVAKNTDNNTSQPATTTYRTLMSAPSNLVATGRTSSSITISFTSPSVDVIDYSVTAAAPSGTIGPLTITTTTYTITELLSDTSYNISVVARNANVISMTSAILEYYTLLLPPTALNVVDKTESTMSISFTAPARGNVTYYELTTTPSSGSTNPRIFSGTYYTITELQSNTSYTINIVAVNSNGSSVALVSSPHKTLLVPPTNLVVSTDTITDTSMNISFTAPTDTSLSYTYEVTALSPDGNVGPQSFSGTSYTITGLTRDTSYTISVISKIANGNYSTALVSGVSYLTRLPPPTNLQATGSTDTSITISFNLPVNAIPYSYDITTSPISIGSSVQKISDTLYNINGLNSGIVYTISVNTRNSAGNISLVRTTSYTTLLLPPTNFNAISSTDSSITVSFTPSVGAVDKYRIYAQPSSGTTVTKEFTQVQSSYVIDGLQTGMTYELWVVAINTNTTSAESIHRTYNTILPPPTSLTATASTSSTISISFTAPSSGIVTNYAGYATSENGSVGPQFFTGTTYTLTGLISDTLYTIKVIALTDYVISVDSNTIDYSTLLLPPTNLVVSNVTDTSMNIAFTAPSRGNVTLYQVALSPSPGGSYPQTFTGTTYTLTGLTTDTLYTINVIARNANGDSVPLTGTQRTLLIPPSQLTSILGNTSINISYTAPPGGSGYTYDISTNPTGSVAIPQGIISTNYNITGLQVDTSYTIFVVSRNGIGNRSLPLTNTYRTLLSPPTNLTATLTDTTIYIGYTRPTGGSAYTFDISTNPTSSVAIPQGIADTSYNITGLEVDTSYTLFVVSRNANGNYSVPLTNTYRTLLSPPSQLTTTLTNTSINISFTASTTASATKYDISASSIYGNIGPITISGTTYNLTGLQVDTSYNLSIVAKNADDTNTSLPLTGTRRTLLVPPTNLITTPTDTTMYVSYTRPSGGSAYIFDISINPTSSVPIPQGIADTSYNITGLEVDTSYTIFVVSRNATNTNTSLPLTGTQRTLLSPPTNLIVTNITDTSMNVAFTASTTASVTNYEISATSIKGNIAPTTITNSPYVLSGLQNDTSYNINIVAKNADDTNTSLPLTGTRRTLLPPPTNLIVTTTDTSMNIAYTASTGSSVTNYEITITSVNGTVGPILNNTATSYVLTGLTKNIIYTISVVAKNAINNTSLPLIGTSQTKLPPPTNLQPTGRTSTSIAISFDPPSDGITYTYDISTSPVSIGSSVTEGTGGNINVIFPPYTIPVSGLNNSLDGVSSLQLVANGTRIVCCGQSYGALMFFTYNGTTWNNRVDVPVSEIPGFFSLSVLPDGSRGVCSGYYGFCYVFTWTGTTYTGFTQTRDTISRREGCGFDMTPDGNTIVFTHTNGGNPRYMYFAKWENGNYNAFTQTLDVARNYFGAGISADGSKIAYGITNANIVYVAYWNGTNYGLGTAINTSSIIYSRHIRFSPDGNIIYATPMYDVNGSVQYSLWNGTNYSTFQYVPTTSMPGNRDTGGFFVQTDGSIGIGVGNSIYKCAVTTISAKAYNINGLQGGTSYTISVNSRNAENNVSLPVTTTYNTLLLPPTNVQGVSRTETSITISFTEPAGSIDSYMVYATYSGGSITPQTFSAPRTSCVITGLQNGTTYTISVVSKNAITTSANSTSIDYYTTLSAPALSSTSSTDSSITILYTPPSPSVTSYTIEATPTFGSNVTQIFSAPAYTPYAVSYQITGLDSNMFYTITMFATNANENSSTSTTTYHTAILPPTSLIAIDRTTNSIDISFNVPSGLTADSYTINAVYSGGSITPITFVPSGSSSVYQTYSITGLSPTTQYTINVFATKVSRNSSASTSITYSTLISPPTNLMKTAITDTTMDISFNKPAGTITSYTVNGTYSGGSITPQTFNNSGVSSVFQTYQITGLLPGTTYTVNVIANNTNISTYSLPSNSITETTLISPPSNLIPLSSNPSTSTIDISFNKPAGTFTSYTVNATYSGGSITPQTITPSVDSNAYQTYTITGLQEGTKYTITVTTNNGGVSSSPSTSILYATNPSPPANFQVIARTSSSLTISFTLPTIYDAISYFVVQITDINNPTRYIYPPFTAPTTTFVIDNLTGNTQYSINIASRITVPSIPATIPATDFVISSVATSNIIDRTLLSPPTNLRGIAKTTSSITIAFDAPTDGIIYTYDISYSPVRVGSSVVTVDNTTYDIIGLESAVLYTILVNTRDANNNTSLQVSTTYSTLLPAPTNLIATGRTTTTIDISFNKPAGTMNSYTVSATYVSGASTLSITPQTFNDSPVSSVFQTYTITGLLSNTKYTANVYATKGSVNSSYSNDIVDYSTLIVQNASFSNYTAFSGTLASSATGISSLSIDNTGTRITVSSSNQGYFIYYTKSGSTWSARNNVLIGSTAAIITMAMTPDGNRGIASGYDNRCYYFTWTGTTYTALTRTLHTTTLGACKGIGITGDGNTIVYTDDSTKCIYFAKWNGTNYNAFTKTLDISRNTYYGLGISSDGSKIAYGQFPGNKVYVAYWNGTNYGVGTAITYLGTAFARHIKFSPGGNVIYMSMLSDASGSIQYSILNIDTYPTFKYIPTTSIPASFDAAGFYVDLSGVLYVYRTQSVNTSTPTYTPPAT